MYFMSAHLLILCLYTYSSLGSKANVGANAKPGTLVEVRGGAGGGSGGMGGLYGGGGAGIGGSGEGGRLHDGAGLTVCEPMQITEELE